MPTPKETKTITVTFNDMSGASYTAEIKLYATKDLFNLAAKSAFNGLEGEALVNAISSATLGKGLHTVTYSKDGKKNDSPAGEAAYSYFSQNGEVTTMDRYTNGDFKGEASDPQKMARRNELKKFQRAQNAAVKGATGADVATGFKNLSAMPRIKIT